MAASLERLGEYLLHAPHVDPDRQQDSADALRRTSPTVGAAFHAYVCPAPAGFDKYPGPPAAAYFHRQRGGFILPSEAVRSAENPAHTLLFFLRTTYEGAAHLASGIALGWNAKGNERMAAKAKDRVSCGRRGNMKPFPNIPDAEGASS